LTTQYFLLTCYLLTYLLKSNPGNPVPATGYPVPKPVPMSNHYNVCDLISHFALS